MPGRPTESLSGRTVMVTRPRGQAGALCRMVREAGGIPLCFPVIEILPPVDAAGAAAVLAGAERFDMVIFISANAVEQALILAPALFASAAGTVLAAGPATGAALARHGVDARCAEDGADGGGAALLRRAELQAANVNGRGVLIVRGEGGREALRRELEARGARVGYAEVYRRAVPAPDPETVKKIWQQDRPDVIVITSLQGLVNLVDMTGREFREQLFDTPLAVISPRIMQHAAAAGFRGAVATASSASDAGLITAVRHALEMSP